MKGTFKESKIDVIDLSSRRMDSIFEQVVGCGMVIISESDLKRYKALETTNKLLQKCLDEATEDRERYRAMWLQNGEARKEYYRLYKNAKHQLDELNIMFDKYIKREKIIQGKGCWECSYCDPIFHFCQCRESDNYNELVGSECRCERYREYKPDADTEIL